MQFSYSLVLFAAVVFTTFCIQGITGFGSTILALPFVIYLVDDPHVVIPTLTILSLIFCSVLLIKDYRNIAWRKMGNMLIYMVIGGPFGVLLFKSITREVFLPFLGCIIIIIAVWGLLSFTALISGGLWASPTSSRPVIKHTFPDSSVSSITPIG